MRYNFLCNLAEALEIEKEYLLDIIPMSCYFHCYNKLFRSQHNILLVNFILETTGNVMLFKVKSCGYLKVH